ncbi:MAG: hypothetical protein Q8K86_08985 [Candidatus Nanopelagicaceae bacterium]|nr:hypothetical protein [Candidatus Nanopelagicaceae bacterium]
MLEHMLIDGKNCVYRSVFASRGSQVHPATVLLRFLSSYIDRFGPQKVHVFWEGNRSALWRRSVLPTYKAREHNHDFDVDAAVKRTQIAAIELLKWMKCRQYCQKHMEADDLIYAFCRAFPKRDIMIVSSDGDFAQIPFFYPSIKLYDPMKDRFIDPTHDVVEVKSLSGDKSDGIKGYYGVGEIKAKKLLDDVKKFAAFMKERGAATYKENRQLVDLSLCPGLIDNVLYVRWVSSRKVEEVNEKEILSASEKYKVVGLRGELHNRLLMPFKSING